MEEISLSSRELLVLASYGGASNFFGVRDSFSGMSPQEIHCEIPTLQMSLEKRGYATVGFDSDFRVKPDISNIVNICTNCEKYVSVDGTNDGLEIRKELLYCTQRQNVKLIQNDDEVLLSYCSPTTFASDLANKLCRNCCNLVSDSIEFDLPKSVLDEAKIRTPEDSKFFLQSNGCNSTIASVISAGLHYANRSVSVVSVDLKRHSVDAMICIISETAFVRLRLKSLGLEETWSAKCISSAEFEKDLLEFIEKTTESEGIEDETM